MRRQRATRGRRMEGLCRERGSKTLEGAALRVRLQPLLASVFSGVKRFIRDLKSCRGIRSSPMDTCRSPLRPCACL